jgi:hypothetical protein
MTSTKTTGTIAPTKCDRALFPGPVIAGVAKRKPASTVSVEQSDRQLSAGVSRRTGHVAGVFD